MQSDPLDLFSRVSAWATEKVAGASGNLDAETPCDQWNVRTLLNHMLETQTYFLASARGEDASRPSPTPQELISDDPVGDFRGIREEMLAAFGAPGVVEQTGPALAIATADQLLHGWDLARATGQETTMPDGAAEATFGMLHGRLTDEQREGAFKPEVPVAPSASPQDRLLGFTGRDPR
jgi:uncharacterized protein (TIGR03086 family)